MKKLLLFLCLSVSINVFAQKDFRPGYIVLNSDTVKGFVKYQGDKASVEKCVFKKSLEDQEKRYFPTELNGYGFESGKKFEALILPVNGGFQKSFFLNVLVKGKSSLYFYRDSTDFDRYYLKTDSGLKELKQDIRYEKMKDGRKFKTVDNSYHKVLMEAFTTCPSILERVKKTNFKESALVGIVASFNTCTTPGTSFYVRTPVKSKLSWGPFVGVNSSNLKITGDIYLSKADSYKSKISYHGGLFFNKTLPKVNEKISIQVEALFTRNKYIATFAEQGNFGRMSNYDITFDISYLNFPLLVRYRAASGKYKPFLNVGIVNGFAIKNKQEEVKTSTFGSSSYTDRNQPFKEFRNYSQALALGIGSYVPMAGAEKLNLELRYEIGNGFSKATQIKTAVNTLSVNLGWQF
ncbi:porin family protein [Adhaeribacter soli]|uniref:PorT family protein n=1 Tax=Adhaeribacter soli TaxID=2607655 RepID=A0A5N1J382_9BACT|nr:porin family protein [Adhaeribacter soli]KAA9340976.1 PorT family protein [Adhaeribacter soli]